MNEPWTPPRRAFFLGAASAALCGGAAIAQCHPGDVLVGQTATDYICQRAGPRDFPACGSVPDTQEGLQALQDSLRRQMQSNGREAARVAGALEEWSGFLQDRREEARKDAIKIAVDIAIDATLDRAKQFSATRRQETVFDAGLFRREWGALTDRLSRMPPGVKNELLGRISQWNTAERGFGFLHEGWQAIDTAYDAGAVSLEPNWKTKKAAAVSVLRFAASLGSTNPAIAMLVTDLDAGENALYGWWSVLAARNRLQQFMALEDPLLHEQTREADRYVLVSNALRAIGKQQTYCI